MVDGSTFDSSYKRGKPFETVIGVGKVVKGWDIGIPSMELGEKAELSIKSEYGYGNRKRPGIPAGSTMIFTVELLGINGREVGEEVETKVLPEIQDVPDVPDYPIYDNNDRPTGLGPPNKRPLRVPDN